MVTVRTVEVSDVNPGTGNTWYTSLAAAVAGESGNLVTQDIQLNIRCYAFSDTGGSVDLSSFTSDATRFVHIFPVDSSAAAAADWDTSKYTLSVGSGLRALNLGRYVFVERIQIHITGNVTRGLEVDSNSVVDGIHMKGNGLSGVGFLGVRAAYYDTNASSAAEIRNMIIEGLLTSQSGFGGDGTNYTKFLNCTAVGSGAGSGFYTSRTNMHEVTNCVAIGFNSGFDSAMLGDYNASDDTTAPGTNSLHSISDPFTDVANDDYSISPGSALIDAGTDLSSYFDTDIVGTTRPQGSEWDIGAFEYISAAPSAGFAYVQSIIVG